MELIAWHYVWDNRFLAGLSHRRSLRITCWLPSILIGAFTLYQIWEAGLDKFEKEKTYYLETKSSGVTAECAIVKDEHSLANV